MFLILMCCVVQPLLVTSGIHQESCLSSLYRALRIGVFLEYLESPSADLINDACTFSSSSISLGLSFMVEQPYVRMG